MLDDSDITVGVMIDDISKYLTDEEDECGIMDVYDIDNPHGYANTLLSRALQLLKSYAG